VCCEQGVRDKNEDTFVVRDALGAETSAAAIYGVYDGHCGKQAADAVARDLHDVILAQPCLVQHPEQALVDSFLALDRDFLVESRKNQWYAGTTAVVCLMMDNGRRVYMANLGDSAAVLSRHGQCVALSSAHKPDRPDEKARIEEANGWITEEKELFMGQLHRMDLDDPEIVRQVDEVVQWVTISRVCGELAVSRSIGDPDFKDVVANGGYEFLPYPEGHSKQFSADLLLAEPEVQSVQLEPGDEFIVLATDGLWDVMTGPQVVNEVHKHRSRVPGCTPQNVANHLFSLALRLGSADNITILVVMFEFE